jgi:LacI family transcriptional regulator
VQGDFTEDSGFQAAERLLHVSPPPTAIFAANDAMAIGALSALRRASVRVPDEIAVAGFDDIPMARFLEPPLSSVHVDMTALGERATLRLLSAVAEKEQHERRAETLPTTLVLRRSCGATVPSSRPTAPTPESHSIPPHSPPTAARNNP